MILKFKTITILLFFVLVATAQNSPFWYDKPSEKWTQALPIGNGSIGGMIFGGIQNERIQFNESSLITGTTENVGHYQPFGDLFLDFNISKIQNYRRELNLEKALQSVSFTSNGVTYKREYFVSFPHKVMVIHLTASKKNQISFKLRLQDAHKADVVYKNNAAISEGTIVQNGMKYESQLLVKNKDGLIRSDATGITVENATEATILLVAGTDFVYSYENKYKGTHPHQRLTTTIQQAAGKSYQQLLSSHVTDYQLLFNRVSLKLGANNADKPISERLLSYKNGTPDAAMDKLLFDYGRYLLISSSRKGGTPANLQGIWNAESKPAWYSQYTTNINIQMNYWLAELTNLSECHEPLFDWVENLAKVQKNSNDTNLITKKGWICYSTNTLMGTPSKWRLHRPGSAWLSQHLWEHYAFTGNKEFLIKRAYPMLKELTGYWEDYLVEAQNGKLISPTGWSPEHGPGLNENDKNSYPGASYDQQIVYDLFSNYIEASEALDLDKAYREKIKVMRARLLGPQIGKWGQLQEWMEDWDDPNDKHRHHSHLFAVYPGRQITMQSTSEFAKAALVSVIARGDKNTEWSTAWKINIYARLCQSERAYDLIKNMFSNCLHDNMFGNHPPFQMDGNYGFTAGVAEMLLQSHVKENDTYVLQILPALPKEWPTGEIKGLRARGGFVVDISWKNSKLTKLKIRTEIGGTFSVQYNNKQISKTLSKNSKWETTNL
jgi:alpha-L-fucosidase 2